jgi:CRISPR/Cas system CSM-associated protein Csm3 (group 7 of RAMP superfamily)
MDSAGIIGRIILAAKLVLESPLIIGSGDKGEAADITVLKDFQGRPYIPATSLTGVMRHYFMESFSCESEHKKQVHMFWGYEDRNKKDYSFQSALITSDVMLSPGEKAVIRVRDGVKIDSQLGISVEGSKYDYEVVESGASFDLKLELTFREENQKQDVFREILAILADAMEQGEISLGAMTTKGFGRFRLKDVSWYDFDFTKKDDVFAWLERDLDRVKADKINPRGLFSKKSKDFKIKALFSLKNSLIIRSYSGIPEDPDAVHITSGGSAVLPGTSVKGALRSRAHEIVKVLGGEDEMIKTLFGWAETEGTLTENNKSKIKSRVTISETKIKNTCSMVQNRIKIDRFTGGTINGALFNTMPLWPGSEEEMVTLEMQVSGFEEWEAGLLLLLLKDLWTGDLPIGGEKNVGRGVLKGISAEIKADDNTIRITATPGEKLILEGKGKILESYVSNLADKCEKRGGRS